jgi:hypothetical protein
MRKSQILLILFISFTFSSCEKNCDDTQKEVKEIMKNWYKKKINFPDNTEVLTYNSEAKNTKISITKKYTIVHFFTAD